MAELHNVFHIYNIVDIFLIFDIRNKSYIATHLTENLTSSHSKNQQAN